MLVDTHLIFAHPDLLKSIVQYPCLGLVDGVYGIVCIYVFSVSLDLGFLILV